MGAGVVGMVTRSTVRLGEAHAPSRVSAITADRMKGQEPSGEYLFAAN